MHTPLFFSYDNIKYGKGRQPHVILLFSEKRSDQYQKLSEDWQCRDIEFDECTGQIHKIVISEGFHFCRFFEGSSDIVICYKDIKQIGPDIILVDLCCS